MQWTTSVLRPGRQPGMASPEAFPVARHCIRLSGVGACEAASELAGRLKALERADGSGTLVSSWLPDEHRGAVLAPVAHGAIPLVIEGLRKLLATASLKILIIGNILAIGGVDSAGIDAVMDAGGVNHWLRHVMQPVRLLAGPCQSIAGHEQQAYELARPSAGLAMAGAGGLRQEPDAVVQSFRPVWEAWSRLGRWRLATREMIATGR